jgi:hypothetical protein
MFTEFHKRMMDRAVSAGKKTLVALTITLTTSFETD